jgi:hypothetical protein
MSEASKLNTVKSPASIALIGAIEKQIEDIATDKMTPVEVLGVLDLVGKRFYEESLSVLEYV